MWLTTHLHANWICVQMKCDSSYVQTRFELIINAISNRQTVSHSITNVNRFWISPLRFLSLSHTESIDYGLRWAFLFFTISHLRVVCPSLSHRSLSWSVQKHQQANVWQSNARDIKSNIARVCHKDMLCMHGFSANRNPLTSQQRKADTVLHISANGR